MNQLQSLFQLAEAGANAGGLGSTIYMIVMILGLVAVFYFFLYRPQKKQERETAEMRDSIELGDVISTVGGIIGVVVRIKDEMLLIETGADRTRLQVMKWAVRGVEEKAHPVAEPKKGEGKGSRPKLKK